ncbi:hypothetical protein CY34DRAFT_798455 [Suillus luteus UH-Slu-Lm8-n1]|uniref:Unplaced genomic scaffold CY34scaffold_8, whole genome shotgun sequence n=1 Tax=Suillus luteus UH-Slu-Lm8-n1 TaxID=930992 RepID=A0A0D0B2T8_9AGAM|nr:hypothetical protein CY34DRAFT_798455 [Suillus luteus UH-Slu-Lm8-n1]
MFKFCHVGSICLVAEPPVGRAAAAIESTSSRKKPSSESNVRDDRNGSCVVGRSLPFCHPFWQKNVITRCINLPQSHRTNNPRDYRVQTPVAQLMIQKFLSLELQFQELANTLKSTQRKRMT